MGTYTTNKNLFMPTVGETGWGTLVNGNFETIDNFLKPISLSGSTYTFTGNQTGGSINATSIANSGTLTNTGKIVANDEITTTKGVYGADFNNVPIKQTVNVSPSPNIIRVLYFNWNGIFVYNVLPFINGVTYTGNLTLYGTYVSNAPTLAITTVHGNNTTTSARYSATTNYSFDGIRALYVCKSPADSNDYNNVCSVPIFS